MDSLCVWYTSQEWAYAYQPGMLNVSFKSNVDAVSRKLTNFSYQQLPFAEAQAVTQLAKLAQHAEKAAMPTLFDKPTPFTVNSVAECTFCTRMTQREVFVVLQGSPLAASVAYTSARCAQSACRPRRRSQPGHPAGHRRQLGSCLCTGLPAQPSIVCRVLGDGWCSGIWLRPEFLTAPLDRQAVLTVKRFLFSAYHCALLRRSRQTWWGLKGMPGADLRHRHCSVQEIQ